MKYSQRLIAEEEYRRHCVEAGYEPTLFDSLDHKAQALYLSRAKRRRKSLQGYHGCFPPVRRAR
jgi:hypothetical protein